MAKGIYPPLRLVNDFETTGSVLWEYFQKVPEDFKVAGKIAEMSDDIQKQLREKGMRLQDYRQLMSCIVNFYIIEEWREQKQVYDFPDEMFEIFCKQTEDFDMDKRVFEYLPYKSIYLELNGYRGYHGMIMRYCKLEEKDNMLFLLIKNDGITYRTLNFEFKEEEKFSDSIDRFVKDEDRENVKTLMAFGFQAAMYLCTKNCDIEENLVTKRTYKPGGTIKNKFSEIRKWNVAERVVQEYKKSIKKIEDDEYKDIQIQNMGEDSKAEYGSKKRNSPRMHWRKGHWQRYRIGKGRTEIVWKFIPPGIVNFTEDTLPIVRHI